MQDKLDNTCGFCEYAVQEASKHEEYRCNHCIKEAKKICEKYLTVEPLIMTNQIEEITATTNTILEEINRISV